MLSVMRSAPLLLKKHHTPPLTVARRCPAPAADVPTITSYPPTNDFPDGQTTPTPSEIDFTPGELLGCVSGKLGLEKWAADNGHELVVTSDKDGDGCELEEHLPTADYVISQPFWPAYITRERMDSAPNLKAAITAGIGVRETLPSRFDRGCRRLANQMSCCTAI